MTLYFGLKKTMTNPKIKNKIKPVNYDIHLEYKCPDCATSHWLTLRESKTKGFRVVCVCDCVFSVKRINDIRIKYVSNKSLRKTEVKEPEKLPHGSAADDLYNKCMITLSQYSFSEEEMGDILKETINSGQLSTIVDIVKACVTKFGEKNNA